MPTQINGFQCAKCLYVHPDFETAQKCESKHGTKFKHTPEFEHGRVGPAAIRCTFVKENGETRECIYYRA